MTAVHLSASRAYPVPLEQAFDAVLPMPLPDLFRHRYGPLPPIKAVTGFTDPWSEVGQARTIHLADGGTMVEELTAVDRPVRFAYRISDIAGAMKPLVGGIDGAWSFEAVGTGTRVTWSWDVYPASTVSGYLMPVFGRLWGGYARQALENLEDLLLR
ncbi:MAG: SRPBCC family protein [Nocardioides sp.]